MANTAFGHDATLTTPGSTTDTALVRWANTSGTSLNNTINILSDGSNITLNARGEVRFSDADSTHYIAFESPATVSTSYTMTLPADLPAADEVLTVTSYSSGAGVLEWAAVAAGGDFSNGGDNGALVLGTNDSNTLTFETNNTARMTILSSGYVGIGVTSPSGIFHVAKSGDTKMYVQCTSSNDWAALQFLGNGGTARAEIRGSTGSGRSDVGDLYIRTNDLDRVHVTNAGEVKVKENASMPSVTKGIAKGWANFEVDGNETASYNVNDVTDHGTGDWEVIWEIDFNSVNGTYAFGVENNAIGDVIGIGGGTPAAGAIRLRGANDAGTTSDLGLGIHIVAFGAQV
jgi:hypothetical protein